MRVAPKSEQEKSEIQAAERQGKRKGAFKIMQDRDRGWAELSNGAHILWHRERPKDEGVVWTPVPDGCFALDINGKRTLFDAEEFRKHLRWV